MAGNRLWNRDFLLLWSGQLVSVVGDVVYGIGLGFWVLQRTGSTALMGAVLTASTLPRVLVSPFAGVLVDRLSRKWFIVVMDLCRGLAVLAVAAAALTGRLEVWMVFAAGIVIGVGSAFFGPAVSAALPDIVPAPALLRANSAYAMNQTGASIFGNALGGFLFQSLGGGLLFLANGVSYVVAGLASLFMRIPRVAHRAGEFRFFRDLAAGFAFVWRDRGIRDLTGVAAALNFLAVIGFTLLLPIFQQAAHLGPGRYGVVMAGLTGGMFAGFMFTSAVNVPFRHRFAVFYALGVMSMAAAVVLPAWLCFPAMVAAAVLSGAGNAVVNSLLGASLQAATPADMRGKVFSLIGAIAGGLTPIAFAVAGALAEVLPARAVSAGAFGLTMLVFLLVGLSAPTRRLVGFDPGEGAAPEAGPA